MKTFIIGVNGIPVVHTLSRRAAEILRKQWEKTVKDGRTYIVTLDHLDCQLIDIQDVYCTPDCLCQALEASVAEGRKGAMDVQDNTLKVA